MAWTGSLLGTALLMGLAATPHCATMCAAACAAASRAPTCRVGETPDAGASLRASLPVLGGRLAGYAAAGALAASLGQVLGWIGATQAWVGPFWTMAQLMVLVLGAVLLLRGAFPPAWVAQVEQRWRGRPGLEAGPAPSGAATAARRFALAMLWPAAPCGVLHAALLLAALASTPGEGALVMLVFGLGSLPGLVLGRRLWLTAARAWRKQRAPAGAGPVDGLRQPAWAPAGTAAPGRSLALPLVAAPATASVETLLPAGDVLAVRLAGAMLMATSAWWLVGHRLAPAWAAFCA